MQPKVQGDAATGVHGYAFEDYHTQLENLVRELAARKLRDVRRARQARELEKMLDNIVSSLDDGWEDEECLQMSKGCFQ